MLHSNRRARWRCLLHTFVPLTASAEVARRDGSSLARQRWKRARQRMIIVSSATTRNAARRPPRLPADGRDSRLRTEYHIATYLSHRRTETMIEQLSLHTGHRERNTRHKQQTRRTRTCHTHNLVRSSDAPNPRRLSGGLLLARLEKLARLLARPALTEKHNPGPKTHMHRQSEGRNSNDSQKSALGPRKDACY